MTIPITLLAVLALAALIVAITSAMGRAPLWVAVVLLSVIELLHAFPSG